MTKFLTQPQTTPAVRKGKKRPSQPQTELQPIVVTGPPVSKGMYSSTPSIQHEINHVAGLSGIEQSLDCLVDVVRRITGDGYDLSLSTGHNTDPVKITLADNDYSDTMDRLITAFERIADSVAKLAGLSRPRLESWHEQDAYEPRYKDVACDGGAPGPCNTNKTKD
jgi:hypothetical protein